MSFEIDPKFRGSGRRARRRRLRRRVLRLAAVVWVLVLFAGLGFGIAALLRHAPPTELASQGPEAGDASFDGFAMVQTEEPGVGSQELGFTASFIDLTRDPMILRLAQSDSSSVKPLAGPPDFVPDRAGLPAPDRLSLLHDTLFVAERRLVTKLPSSREDFALFQAQRSRAISQMQAQPAQAVEARAGVEVRVESAGSWGAFIAEGTGGSAPEETAGGDGDRGSGDAAVYVETQIENTTSVAIALRESQRTALYDDVVLVLQAERKISELLADNGFSENEAVLVAQAATRELGLGESVAQGSVVAMRFRPNQGRRTLLQVSFYGPEGYIATLAQTGAGRFARAADPWIEDDLLGRSGTLRREAMNTADVRLLDALYSAAIRNGLPTDLVGEMIVIMSKRFDLDRFVSEGDEVTMLYANHPGPKGEGVGRLLFVGIDGPSGKMPCYVTEMDNDSGFGCFDFGASAGYAGRIPGGFGGLGGGLVVPVQGVVTSGFGPRFHPILHQVRNHDGVDWGAPSGTPIVAAAAGTIAFVGDGAGYGNVVYIDHGGGIQTRYAHMSAFADSTKAGAQVRAGDVIGFVGTTGNSTGPHLHFEIRVNGTAVDPITFNGRVEGGTDVVGHSGSGSDAVATLVNQIIAVESGGDAGAVNPLSSATGLGQFIGGTWLRMMRDYRPDLANTMTPAELLALRTDPTLSREMVGNLARENEAYLRARGHEITAGRLYLAHFLGASGADTALRADPSATVIDVMGAVVVNANPFLRDKTIAYLLAWSDRKMSGAGRSVSGGAQRFAVVPPEVKKFREAVDELVNPS